MPTLDDDERYAKMLVSAVQDLAEKLGHVRQEVAADMAALLSNYREDVYRTTMGIHHRLLSYEQELLRDGKARERRQAEIDTQLAAIRNGQVERDKRDMWRMRIEVALIVLAIIVLVWWL